eukprot:CAMPEP_0177658046 /NCGR_PEP_ID=MMETSP0447-20121125/16579_1 /TAXON_ID=0 /ORGANISM="Stygamoeba regulata, Strain BSH-02190019" /LENGTH=767 /DNA_ID=CAMNT_0019162581 /DNA_START=66 /DNA_END=2372 /DNA_ORIENTATION=-
MAANSSSQGDVAEGEARTEQEELRDSLGFTLEEFLIPGYPAFLEQVRALERKQTPRWARYLRAQKDLQQKKQQKAAHQPPAPSLTLEALLTTENQCERPESGECALEKGANHGDLHQQSPYSRRLTHERASPVSSPASSSALAELVRWGVPSAERRALWSHLSGATALRSAQGPQYYAELVAQSHTLPHAVVHQIDLDLERTFPLHAEFNERGLPILRRVLLAYAVADRVIGYCQSLNFVCGFLLLMVDYDEEEAFFLLSSLLVLCGCRSLYARNMVGTKVTQLMFEELLRKHEPKLSAHMDKVGAVPSLISMQWIMTLMLSGFPRELVLIAWDNIFFERTPRFLLMLLLAVLHLHQEAVLKCTNAADLLMLFREPYFTGYFDPETLLRSATKFSRAIKLSTLEKMRTSILATVRLEIHSTAMRRDIMRLKRQTHFTPDQLEVLRREFYSYVKPSADECNLATISLEAFKKVFTKVLPTFTSDGEELEHMYRVLDVDGDGQVSFTELMTLFSTLYKGTPAQRLEFLFQAYDMDNSGYLDREELRMLMSKIRKALSGSASDEADFALWDRAFDSLDTNRDNRLSLEEFREIVHFQPDILQYVQVAKSSDKSLSAAHIPPKTKKKLVFPTFVKRDSISSLEDFPHLREASHGYRLYIDEDGEVGSTSAPVDDEQRVSSTSKPVVKKASRDAASLYDSQEAADLPPTTVSRPARGTDISPGMVDAVLNPSSNSSNKTPEIVAHKDERTSLIGHKDSSHQSGGVCSACVVQ